MSSFYAWISIAFLLVFFFQERHITRINELLNKSITIHKISLSLINQSFSTITVLFAMVHMSIFEINYQKINCFNVICYKLVLDILFLGANSKESLYGFNWCRLNKITWYLLFIFVRANWLFNYECYCRKEKNNIYLCCSSVNSLCFGNFFNSFFPLQLAVSHILYFISFHQLFVIMNLVFCLLQVLTTLFIFLYSRWYSTIRKYIRLYV